MRFLSVVLLLIPLRVLACSCGTYFLDLPVKEMGLTITEAHSISTPADIIFQGTLIATSQCENGDGIMTFKVNRYFKGKDSDTIYIRTGCYSEACGFAAKLHTDCIILTTKGKSNEYHVLRSDCWKSVSQHYHPNKYERYLKFLTVITDKIDGTYTFYHSQAHFRFRDFSETDTTNCEAVHFTIKNGVFDGEWRLSSITGSVLEQGQFEDGQRVGKWKVNDFIKRKYYGMIGTNQKRTIWFKKGEIKRTKTITILDEFDFENNIITIKYFKNGKLRKTKTIIL